MVSSSARVPRPTPRRPVADPEATRLDLTPWHQRMEVVQEDDATADEPTCRRPAVSHVALAPYRQRHPSELLERLSMPLGLDESILPHDKRASGPVELRIAIVRLVREVGRELRALQYVARSDGACIEILQRYLLLHAHDALRAGRDGRTMAPLVARYGVVFGEILVRRSGAEWSYLDGDNPALWRLTLPSGEEVYPVARVQRFVLMQNREQDLVAHFLEAVG